MPIIYLSPSTQEYNPYVTGSGSEEYWMNRLADAMIPYLNSCGIRYSRNTPDMTATSSVRQANEDWYDLYLALHSNASGTGSEGKNRGIIAFYYPGSSEGQRAAQIFVNNLRNIYPLPDKVVTRTTTSLIEVRGPRFPAVLLEIGYHDNVEDAQWIESNLREIARNLVLSLTEYFGLPFIWPITPYSATVSVGSGTLNLRSRPDRNASVIANLPNGASVRVYGEWNGWDPGRNPMNKVDDSGVFETFVPGLMNYQTYKFHFRNARGEWVDKADPFAFYSEMRPGSCSKLYDIEGFPWDDGKWMRERDRNFDRPMAIYEIHLGSWRGERWGRNPSYEEVADDLIPYLQEMGYTHVEVMPIVQYPFDGSWGYQATGFYSVDSRYGNPKQLMSLVNRLHQAGIGVILDFAPVHFATDSYSLRDFDGTHLYEYGDPQHTYRRDPRGRRLQHRLLGREQDERGEHRGHGVHQEAERQDPLRAPRRHDDRRGLHRLPWRHQAPRVRRARLRLQVGPRLDERHPQVLLQGPHLQEVGA